MMTLIELLIWLTYAGLSVVVLVIGLHTILFFPLALLHAIAQHRRSAVESEPWVSIIVPAYNEEAVIGNCVRSILRSDYKRFEIILVNDGSTDNTLAEMQRFAAEHRVRILDKPNGGKAAALNTGIHYARGEVLFFVDADGMFLPTTIREMLRGFHSPQVGAVCGNDAPVNLDRLLPRLLAIQTHVTTGFVRRALAAINCLPIVSGNIGAFRREVLEQTGAFRPGFIGEDLELTWRVHKAGYRVEFQPGAVVYAEVPSALGALWKQRVRWARGLLQTAVLHRDMFFKPKYRGMALYLPLNVFSLAVIPILQLAVLGLLAALLTLGVSPITLDVLGIIGWLGFGATILATLFAVWLARAWRELRFFYLLPLWIPYAFFLNLVALWALILELTGAQAQWRKLTRTGVVTRKEVWI